MAIVLTDPTYSAPDVPGVTDRAAAHFIRDRRDVPFLKLMAFLSATVIPSGVALFIPGGFHWWLAAVHFALVIYYMGPFILMLHNTSHRMLFQKRWGWMNSFIPFVLGPFFGESPETYFAHHLGMHHPENNLDQDISSTLPYRRDSVTGFLRYFLRFFFAVLFEITPYFIRKGRRSLMVRCLTGEITFYLAVSALFFLVDKRATLVVFIVPFVVTRFAMMAGNWAQHAFVDEAAPENNYRNSITCINATYNRRCYNDGYHIGHHLKQSRHWTEMPVEFSDNLSTYARERAIVFEGIDFFGVWFLLMLKRYDALARRMVALGDVQPSLDERVALLRTRTQWTRGRGAASMTMAQDPT